MAEILLVNPRRRRKNSSKRRAHRKNPHRRRAHRKNPRHRRRANPHFRFHRRRRNPSLLGGTSGIMGTLKTSAKTGLVGALGALGLDLTWGYGSSYLPAALNTGYVMYLSKALMAALVGIVGGKLLKGRGQALATGAMTVVFHDALKSTLQTAMPSLPLGAYVGTSPIVAYGAPAVGYPQIGVPRTGIGLRTGAIPSATAMGEYLGGVGGWGGASVEGTDWS